MSGTGGSAPPIFADGSKFNGSNWVNWRGLIQIAADLRGVRGYLDGTVTQPPQPSLNTLNAPIPPPPNDDAADTPPTPPIITQTTTTTPDSPWESTIPTPTEWRVRNAWAMGLLIYNTNDPVGLGINISGTAADAWKS
ncbi:hypothetical protein AGABI2DRAFT_79843, partial [Agaricus bisporus var. bisporus H97]|uniref:hypothetical protein n=1 Tax=Agaricus bisporus var. bisporus (strain H97 / ATCC MYA-4626 / FGSC 10389) TaxID=936046 RepID=UPI00029F6C69